jgi:hypothetical protein
MCGVRGLIGLNIGPGKAQPRPNARSRQLAAPHEALDSLFCTGQIGRDLANRQERFGCIHMILLVVVESRDLL